VQSRPRGGRPPYRVRTQRKCTARSIVPTRLVGIRRRCRPMDTSASMCPRSKPRRSIRLRWEGDRLLDCNTWRPRLESWRSLLGHSHRRARTPRNIASGDDPPSPRTRPCETPGRESIGARCVPRLPNRKVRAKTKHLELARTRLEHRNSRERTRGEQDTTRRPTRERSGLLELETRVRNAQPANREDARALG
jgi:hypothetical protein